MEKDGLVFAHITEYMRKIRREKDSPLGELERKAREEKYPVAEPETADLLEILCMIKQPKNILEIGNSSIGLIPTKGKRIIKHCFCKCDQILIAPSNSFFQKEPGALNVVSGIDHTAGRCI